MARSQRFQYGTYPGRITVFARCRAPRDVARARHTAARSACPTRVQDLRLRLGRTFTPRTAHGTNPGVETRSEEHTSELQSRPHLVCRLLLEKKKKKAHQAAKRHLTEQRARVVSRRESRR